MAASLVHHAQQIIGQIDQASTEDDYLHVLQQLDRLDLGEEFQWFMPYYSCLSCVLLSMLDVSVDKKDEYVEDGERFLRRLQLIQPNHAETLILNAFWLQAKIMVSILLRGPLYIKDIEKLLETAQALDPHNPRVYFLKAQTALNKPSFIGGGKKKALPILIKAKAKYEAFTPDYELAPDWGHKQTLELLQKIS